MKKIQLLFILHNHQPCDNFGWVFEDAYNNAYKPFIDTLEKYPKVKVVMHYSGSLLEWLKKSRPEFLNRIKTLVKKGQITLLSGGFYEPIFPIIPDCDKAGQIGLLTNLIKENFDVRPKGLWLAERVWQKGLSNILLKSGLEYTILDENHFREAGLPKDKIYGYFEVENRFKVFAISKRLRYMIPFAKVREIAKYFEEVAKKPGSSGEAVPKARCLVFADDGEKFGLWPHTNTWVYRKKWLEKFFRFLSDNKDIVETVTFNEVFGKLAPSGTVDLGNSSYSEMMEWSEGDFNNFFKIYPEANIMRNRMLYLSEKIGLKEKEQFMIESSKKPLNESRRELYKAQSGCAYWHGVFGGLYFNHLRSGVYKHLINAENILNELSKPKIVYCKTRDFDNDRAEEVIMGNKFLDLYIKPGNAGSIFGLDNKRKSYNMVNIITRRREKYHSKLFNAKKNSLKNVKKGIVNGDRIDLHDVLGVKDRGLKKFLIYDDSKKDSILEYLFTEKRLFGRFSNNNKNTALLTKSPYSTNKIIDNHYVSLVMEKEEFVNFQKDSFKLYIKKELTLSNSSEFCVEYTLKNLSKKVLSAVFATEFNWSFMNKDFLKEKNFRRVNSFSFKDEWTDISLKYRFNDYIRLRTKPIYTLNETEAGLAKTYQYLSFVAEKPFSLQNEENLKFNTTVTVE